MYDRSHCQSDVIFYNETNIHAEGGQLFYPKNEMKICFKKFCSETKMSEPMHSMQYAYLTSQLV